VISAMPARNRPAAGQFEVVDMGREPNPYRYSALSD
jgi:hypothetical protein